MYVLGMETVKEKLKMAIENGNLLEVDALVHAWAAGHVTARELDEALSVQARIRMAEGTEMHAKKTVNVGAVKN